VTEKGVEGITGGVSDPQRGGDRRELAAVDKIHRGGEREKIRPQSDAEDEERNQPVRFHFRSTRIRWERVRVNIVDRIYGIIRISNK